MKSEGYRSKAKRSIQSWIISEIKGVFNRIISSPLNTLKGLIVAGIGLGLAFFADEIYLFLLAFSAANPPLLTAVAFAVAVIGFGILVLAIAEIFFGSYLYSGAASQALTQLFEEQLDEEEMVYYRRLKGDSKECREVSETYERSIKDLYDKKSKTLGVDIKHLVEDPSGELMRSACEDSKHFLTMLHEMHFKRGLTDGIFSEAQEAELEALFNDHFSMNDKRDVSLSNLNLIEDESTQDNPHRKRSSAGLADFDLDSEIENSETSEYKPSDIIRLTKQAINHLKLNALFKRGKLGNILGDSDAAPFSKKELNQASRLMNVLHKDYSHSNSSRLTDLFQIFAGDNMVPNDVTANLIYVLLNNATQGTLKNNLPNEEVFKDRVKMKTFIDSYDSQGASLGEAINMVQCFNLLLEPNLPRGVKPRSRHAEDLPHQDPREADENRLSRSASRRPIYEDEEGEGDSRHLDL